MARLWRSFRPRPGENFMSSFSAEWLALREPHDFKARNPTVLAAVSAAFRSDASLRVVDLACGAGSTSRALSQHLPVQQDWELVDNDPHLLSVVRNGPFPDATRLNTTEVDLAVEFEVALD